MPARGRERSRSESSSTGGRRSRRSAPRRRSAHRSSGEACAPASGQPDCAMTPPRRPAATSPWSANGTDTNAVRPLRAMVMPTAPWPPVTASARWPRSCSAARSPGAAQLPRRHDERGLRRRAREVAFDGLFGDEHRVTGGQVVLAGLRGAQAEHRDGQYSQQTDGDDQGGARASGDGERDAAPHARSAAAAAAGPTAGRGRPDHRAAPAPPAERSPIRPPRSRPRESPPAPSK